jgi:hypothetical protein
MRKTLTLFVCTAAVLMMFGTACKKDSKSPQELVMGKWNLHSVAYKEVDGTDIDEDTEDYSQSGWYVEFRNDGKMYSNLGGVDDTLTYTVVDAQTIVVDGDTTKLSKLNANELTIYYKETATDYSYETWTNFKK